MKNFGPALALLLNMSLAGSLLAENARVTVSIFDTAMGKPMPGRIHLKDAEGKPQRAANLPFWFDHCVCGGTAQFNLPAGTYTCEVERGPEYSVAATNFMVGSDAVTNMSVWLDRVANMSAEGWWSGDLHVHRPLRDAELLMRAEDLHVAQFITWWNKQNPWATNPLPARPLVTFDGDRFYHQLAGEDERDGGALLYFNLREPLAITEATRHYPSSIVFAREARKRPGVWIDMEKAFWWDLPLWVALGVGDSLGIAHNHMHRSGVLDNEAWGRPRDRQRFAGTSGNGLWTQEIYYHLLNCGLRVPPSAGSASGVLPNPVGYDRVYVHVEGQLTWEKWWEGLRAGRSFVSNGPLLRCRAKGRWPGHVFTTTPDKPLDVELEVQLTSRDPVRAIEIIQNGKVLRSMSFDLKQPKSSLGKLTFDGSGWFLVRVIAAEPNTFRFASTAPFYIEAGATKHRISKASAQFFVDWVRERMGRIQLEDFVQRAEVLRLWQDAEKFWLQKAAQANAD